MAILYDSAARTFTLHTTESTYQMKADAQNVLLHTYFGSRADGTDFSYLIVPRDYGYCSEPAENTAGREYSLDYFPQEYPVYGDGDYRVSALQAGIAGQAPALALRYVSHRILPGKYDLPGLPTLFSIEEGDAETLEIVLKDLYEEIYVTLLYGVFEEKNIITRAAVIGNRGAKTVKLSRVMSMGLDFPEGGRELISFYGKHTLERQLERKELCHGITEISSTRGTSSHHHNPFVIVCDRDTTEDAGACCALSLVYSGSFKLQAEVDQFDSLRIVCGLNDNEFEWMLGSGEAFAAPEAVLSYTEKGLSGLSNGLQKAYRENLIRSPWKNRKRPILANNWEATYFKFTGGKLLELARQAADLGLELFVLDDGWFGKRDDDRSGLGDWYVNEEKLGRTLGELADRIHALGLKFGLWIEPEMVSEDSDLYRAHPDWAFVIPGRDPNRSRSQLLLDFSRQEVREYIKGRIDDLFASADIEYIKWDMNRSIGNVYSAADPGLSQGAVRHKYILGLYEVLEHMLAQHPDLLLEGCSGGGGRFDAGMLYYAPQIWCSDNTDAIERLRIHYGTSFGYPMSAAAAHVSTCPNHQNGRTTPFRTRGVCAMQGAFGYELDLDRMTQEEKDEARRQIRLYNENWELFQQGNYYRLASPYENPDFTAWSYVSPDQSRASLSVVYTDVHASAKPYRLKWKGLLEDAFYELDGKLYSGTALMRGGTVLPWPECDYDSYMTVIERKN